MVETAHILAEISNTEPQWLVADLQAPVHHPLSLDEAVQAFQIAVKPTLSRDDSTALLQQIVTIHCLIQENTKKQEPPEMTDRNYRKLMLMAILTGIVCLTPIVLKCRDIFLQRPQQPLSFAMPFDLKPLSAWLPLPEWEQIKQLWQPEDEQPLKVAQQAQTIPTQTLQTLTKVVNHDNVNVRAEPSVKTRALVRLKHKEQVNILEDRSQEADGYHWSKIQTPDGQVGWVADQFLSDS